MNKIKCECGHVNPHGTVLCEACGKPIEGNQHIDGNEGQSLLNMRYEGSARRSQTYNKSIVDKVWNFFSSVKVGVWLIIITLIASAIGTIFPQEIYIPGRAPASTYYESTYGLLGKIYYQLGLHNLYSSWWYILLIALIGISLVICSIDRFVPLYRALKKQKPRRHENFLKRQRLFSETEIVSEEDVQKVKDQLKKHRYKITEENGHLLAEKGRFSRWGPYVNHIGLIIILIAAIIRTFPFMYSESSLWLREGEMKAIPNTDHEYYIENEKFTLEFYDENDPRFGETIKKTGALIPSLFQTDVVIYKKEGNTIIGQEPELKEVQRGEIRVNEAMKIDGYSVYQASYQNNEFGTMTFKLHEKNDPDEKSLGEFTVNLEDPKEEYVLENGFKVRLDKFYPEFFLEDGVPSTKSKYPRYPAFVFLVYPPEIDEPEKSFLGIGFNLDPNEYDESVDEKIENEYKLSISNFETRFASGLKVKKDYSLPMFFIGAMIFMIGVVQGMYWYHRRIWIHPTKRGVWLAGHTNKNWFGLKREIEKVLSDTDIKLPVDQQELK